MLKTYEDLVGWIREHVPSDRIDGTPEEAARWFVAVRTASSLLDSSTKELARDILDGQIGPVTKESCTEFLATWGDEEDQETLIEVLTAHFIPEVPAVLES